jgi:hypothetical protein
MSQLSSKLPWEQANPKWASQLNPILANPILNGQQIDGIILVSGTPLVVYHSLGQIPQGWFLVDNIAACEVYRTQAFNSKTITLEASANTTVSIWIY